MICKKCGKELQDDAKFCTACGAKVEDSTQNDEAETEKQTAETPETENGACADANQNSEETVQPIYDLNEKEQEPAADIAGTGMLTCPRCGNTFNAKEKKCPHCGLKNNLKLCKTCGATIAKNAKRCPKCGAKNKKPIYKRVWFWILAVIAVLIVVGRLSPDSTEATDSQESVASKNSSLNAEEQAVLGRWNGVYLYDRTNDKITDITSSGKELYIEFNEDKTGVLASSETDDLNFHWGYISTSDDGDKIYSIGDPYCVIVGSGSDISEYAGDLMVFTDEVGLIFERQGTKNTSTTSSTVKASNKSSGTTGSSSSSMTSGQKNALKKAESYLKYSAFSYTGLIEQLEYEGYSNSDVTYAVDHCGADWKEQAVKKAESYLKYSSFSKSGLIEQLEYEGFTHEQAVYGADQAY